jgi:hypothetical protein
MVTAITGSLNGSVLETDPNNDDNTIRVPVTNLLITGLAPLGSFGSPDNLLFPIGTVFGTGPAAFTSVSNLNVAPPRTSNGGLEFLIADGAVRILSAVAPNSDSKEATGNFYEEINSPGGFGVGVFTLSQSPSPPPGR